MGDEFPLSEVQSTMVEGILRHEIGHRQIALKLGLGAEHITFIFLEPAGLYDGGAYTVSPGFTTLGELDAHLEKRVLVELAGAFSEALREGKVHEEDARGIFGAGAATDLNKALEHVALLRGIRMPDATKAEAEKYQRRLWQELWVRARDMVEAEQRAISGVAAQLAQRVTVGRKEYVFMADELDALYERASRSNTTRESATQ